MLTVVDERILAVEAGAAGKLTGLQFQPLGDLIHFLDRRGAGQEDVGEVAQ